MSPAARITNFLEDRIFLTVTAASTTWRSSGAQALGFPTIVRTMGSSSSGGRRAVITASVSPNNSATVQGAENEAVIEASV